MLDDVLLYGYWRSSATWRVRIVLHLKGVGFKTEPVHLVRHGGEQRGDAHRARNAMAQVPVLQWTANGTVERLTQSLAIIDFLESTIPNPSIYPADPLQKARALEIAEIINSGIQPMQNLSTLQMLDALGGDSKSHAANVIEKGLVAIERLVSVDGYAVGDAPSIADVCLIPQLYNARRFAVDLTPFPRLRRIEERCTDNPAFVAARPEAQPDAE